jgi:hypothetical protein
MKTKHVIVLLIVVIAVTGGFGWVYTRFPQLFRSKVDPGPVGTKVEVLSIRDPDSFSEEANAPRLRPSEMFKEDFKNFWFQNDNSVPVRFGVIRVSCKCSSVHMCLAPDEVKNLSPAEQMKRGDDSNLNWQGVDDVNGVEVAPGAAGWIRMGWTGKKAGPEGFGAELWMQKPENGTGGRLEARVTIVEPVRIRAEVEKDRPEANFARLLPGEKRTAQFLIWSSTRPHFTIKAQPSVHPCVVIGDPQELKEADRAALSKLQDNEPILCAYRVAVTVHERIEGKGQLDLGPFRRHIKWIADVDPEHPIAAAVQGMVEGEVKFYSPNGKFHIDLGAIRPDDGVESTFELEAENPDIQLDYEPKGSPDFLDVKLQDNGNTGGAKTWRVTVRFNPESSFRGQFPDRERQGYELTALVFTITKKSETANKVLRRIRVPIAGTVRS